MSTTRLSRPVRLLGQHGMAALMPQMKQGKYFAPMIPKRKAAVLRKQAIVEESFGSFDPSSGGWDPAWDTPKKFFFMKPFKGHLRERDRPERANVITKAMQAMPDKIQKMKNEVDGRKPKKDFGFLLKRIASLSKPLAMKPSGYSKKNKDASKAKKKKK